MHTSLPRLVIAGLGFIVLLTVFTAPAQALPVPSKTAPDQTLTERESDLAMLDSVLEQGEVMGMLAGHGFTREEINQRLAQLSPQELGALAGQVEQLQAAGQPTYVWVLIAILAVVAIVAIAG